MRNVRTRRKRIDIVVQEQVQHPGPEHLVGEGAETGKPIPITHANPSLCCKSDPRLVHARGYLRCPGSH